MKTEGRKKALHLLFGIMGDGIKNRVSPDKLPKEKSKEDNDDPLAKRLQKIRNK